MNDEFKFVTPDDMSLEEYPCGVCAGDIISLKNDLHYTNYKDQPTGEVRSAGSEAMVLTGNPEEPDVVWLRWHDGERATWDETILEAFKVTRKIT